MYIILFVKSKDFARPDWRTAKVPGFDEKAPFFIESKDFGHPGRPKSLDLTRNDIFFVKSKDFGHRDWIAKIRGFDEK